MDNPYRSSNDDATSRELSSILSLASALPWLTTVGILIALLALVMAFAAFFNLYTYFRFRSEESLLRFELYIQHVQLVAAARNAFNAVVFSYLLFCLWRYRSALNLFSQAEGHEQQLVLAHRNVWRGTVVCLLGLVASAIAAGITSAALHFNS
jgi:hypothetical protein